MSSEFSEKDLIDLATMEMPFGRFKGRVLIMLPDAYLLWFEKKGFPNGRLGHLLNLSLQLQRDGLRDVVMQAARQPLRPPPHSAE
ncbi:MAG: DUF3820 family protein [Gammaproteobacteria bacterium]|nr:DUF3820 family protein [Gammaproteobacteria bacterium]